MDQADFAKEKERDPVVKKRTSFHYRVVDTEIFNGTNGIIGTASNGLRLDRVIDEAINSGLVKLDNVGLEVVEDA